MKTIKSLKPNFESKYNQGYFIPRNIEKYIGDYKNIIYRSGWELKFMQYCDDNNAIINWSSEPISIPYISPIDNRQHTYYVDFYVKVLEFDILKQYLIEIKPSKYTNIQLKESKDMTPKQREKYQKYLQDVAINIIKWKTAEVYAKSLGYEFKVWTEEVLFGK